MVIKMITKIMIWMTLMIITSTLCGFHIRPESASPSSAASSPDFKETKIGVRVKTLMVIMGRMVMIYADDGDGDGDGDGDDSAHEFLTMVPQQELFSHIAHI